MTDWTKWGVPLSINTGLSFTVGTYVGVKIDRFLKNRPIGHRTDIDELIRFEQIMNALNAPVILMQLLWLTFEMPQTDSVWIVVFRVAIQ